MSVHCPVVLAILHREPPVLPMIQVYTICIVHILETY